VRRLALLAPLLLAGAAPDDGPPAVEDVVRSPADYAGRALTAPGAGLSGKVTTYDVDGVRKYYLTVGTAGGRIQAGFFLAPPALADELAAAMDPGTNYPVNLAYRVQQVDINGFAQWHGVVTRVEFFDGDGRVVRTLPQPKAKAKGK
jgi:hypothetical protein